jgi:antitoxin Phd
MSIRTQRNSTARSSFPGKHPKARKRASAGLGWQLQDAKNQLSELIRRTADGPQTITLHGRPAAVVLSFAHYRKLSKPDKPIVDFLSSLPMKGLHLDSERDKTPAREVDL